MNRNKWKTGKTQTTTGVTDGDNEVFSKGGADEKPRESFLEALAIVFQSVTVKLVGARMICFCASIVSKDRSSCDSFYWVLICIIVS